MANIHTPSENIKAVHGLSAAITAATTNGAGTDCLGFEDALAVVYGAPSGSGTTSDFKLQESSDNSSFSDVVGGGFTQITTAGGAKFYVMDIKLAKRARYLRLVHVGAGGSAAGQAYGAILLLNPRNAPVSQANAALSV
jgi:hypothetical protein